jgi:hypothetical protein
MKKRFEAISLKFGAVQLLSIFIVFGKRLYINLIVIRQRALTALKSPDLGWNAGRFAFELKLWSGHLAF